MTPIDLTKTLKKYKSGWVAIDETKKTVVAHAKDFSGINKKVATYLEKHSWALSAISIWEISMLCSKGRIKIIQT